MCTLTKNILILASERWPSQCTLTKLQNYLKSCCYFVVIISLCCCCRGLDTGRHGTRTQARSGRAVLIIMMIIYLTCPPWSNTHITNTPPLSTSHLINILHLATLWPLWAEFLNTERAPNTGPSSIYVASHHLHLMHRMGQWTVCPAAAGSLTPVTEAGGYKVSITPLLLSSHHQAHKQRGGCGKHSK